MKTLPSTHRRCDRCGSSRGVFRVWHAGCGCFSGGIGLHRIVP
ncbi:MAG: hypothetical protein J6W02_03200 [Bacteroidaceae bacterium]|nr:hypothetical protein [Bacteroidaceae bacterium]